MWSLETRPMFMYLVVKPVPGSPRFLLLSRQQQPLKPLPPRRLCRAPLLRRRMRVPAAVTTLTTLAALAAMLRSRRGGMGMGGGETSITLPVSEIYGVIDMDIYCTLCLLLNNEIRIVCLTKSCYRLEITFILRRLQHRNFYLLWRGRSFGKRYQQKLHRRRGYIRPTHRRCGYSILPVHRKHFSAL